MRSRRTTALVVAAGLVVASGGCGPRFATGGRLAVQPLGPLARLSWPAAVEDDEGQVVAGYRIEVDGVVVDQVPATPRACVLTGLPAGETVALAVTAIDSAGESSAGRADGGRLSASWTGPVGLDAGASTACVSPTDTDGDRLPDAVETGTGRWAGAGSTGTSPTAVDTDRDGLGDGDESLGTTAGLVLPAIGTTPTKRDILLEYDWFDDALGCGAHSHRPSPAALQEVTDMFAAAPVANPDGTTGIRTIHDVGQGGALSGGTVVADADGVIDGGVNDADLAATKAAHFAPERNGFFHYVLMPHRYGLVSTSSGHAEWPGDDLIVSLQCSQTTSNLSHTVIHELGHNLGLGHGGDDHTNHKPNYISVMNYRYTFPGVDVDCDAVGDGPAAYSTGTRPALDERAVHEGAGVCGAPPIDWDGDGTIDPVPYARDLNDGDGVLQVLRDIDDWARVVAFIGVVATDGDGPSPTPTERRVVVEQPVPPAHR